MMLTHRVALLYVLVKRIDVRKNWKIFAGSVEKRFHFWYYMYVEEIRQDNKELS